MSIWLHERLSKFLFWANSDYDIDAIVDMSIGMSVLSKKYRTKDTQREGIVIRPRININGIYYKCFVGGRLSFKAINPKFLVKYNL